MTVATLRLELRIGDCHTVREKRRRMQTIMTKLHRHFNVSVAGTEGDDDPKRASLLIAAVGNGRREVLETLERVADAVAAYPRAELLSQDISEV